MRKLLSGILLASLTVLFFLVIRPAGALHSAAQSEESNPSPANNPQDQAKEDGNKNPAADNTQSQTKEDSKEGLPKDASQEEVKGDKGPATSSEAERQDKDASKGKTNASPKAQAKDSAQEGFKINVDVALVTTDVTIIGQVPPDMSAEDFIIYDDGVAQPASYFSLDQIPLAIAVLIDASESIRPFQPILQIAGISALRRLKPEDQVTLYTFNLNPKRLVNLTDDRVKIADEISKIQIAFMTNIWDSLYNAANYLADKAPNNRRAIILISDNARRGDSRHNSNRTRVEMLENSVTLLNIRAQDSYSFYDAEWAQSDRDILTMVDETGGEQFRVSAPTALQKALEDAILKLRKQYTIGFYPSGKGKPGTFHKLNIKFAKEDRCPGCRLRFRTGYYSGVTAPNPPPLVAKNKKTPERTAEKVDELLVQRSIVSAGTVDIDLPGLTFTVDKHQQNDAKGQSELKLDVKIPFDRIGFTVKDNKHQCRVRVAVFYGTEKGKILGSSGGAIEGVLSDETYERTMKEGYSFSTTVPLKSEKQIMKVVIYDMGSDSLGSQTVYFP
jgi:VWFA-related protein